VTGSDFIMRHASIDARRHRNNRFARGQDESRCRELARRAAIEAGWPTPNTDSAVTHIVLAYMLAVR